MGLLKLVFIILQISILMLVLSRADNKITSTGKYASRSFKWAVGVRNLEFNFTCDGIDTQYRWTFLNSSVIASNVKGFCGQSTNNLIIHCSQLMLSSTLTVINPGDNNATLYVTDCNSADSLFSQLLSIEYCPDLSSITQERFLNITNSENSEFEHQAVYTCDGHSTLIVDSNFAIRRENFTRICQFNATWSGSNIVICSYAPIPVIQIHNRTAQNNTFPASGYIDILCKLTDLGNPIATSVVYNIHYANSSNETIPMNLTSTLNLPSSPGLNNANVSCQGLNKYTEEIDRNAGFSKPITLNIQFAPISSDRVPDTVSGYFGQPVNIVFTFQANPIIHEDNLNLLFSANSTGANATLNISRGSLKGTSSQNYTYHIYSLRKEDLGIYYLNVSSPMEGFDSLILVRNLKGSVPVPINTVIYAVAGSLAGLLFILLIILFGYVIPRRRRAKGNTANAKKENPVYEASRVDDNGDREERLNPLYGSSGTAHNEKEERVNPLYGSTATEQTKELDTKKKGKVKKSEREERKNPLYASSADGNSVVEEAYAEIAKTKKKEGGSQNPVFSIESVDGDTYAEVKKPKKKPAVSQPDDTYAEVKKDKKGKQVGNLHGTTEEAT